MDAPATPLTCNEHLPPPDKRVIPWTTEDADAFAAESDAPIGLEERTRLVIDACKKQARADNDGMGFVCLNDGDMAERIVALLRENNYKADEYETNDAGAKIGIWFGVGPVPGDDDDKSTVVVDANESDNSSSKKRALDTEEASDDAQVAKEVKADVAV